MGNVLEHMLVLHLVKFKLIVSLAKGEALKSVLSKKKCFLVAISYFKIPEKRVESFNIKFLYKRYAYCFHNGSLC